MCMIKTNRRFLERLSGDIRCSRGRAYRVLNRISLIRIEISGHRRRTHVLSSKDRTFATKTSILSFSRPSILARHRLVLHRLVSETHSLLFWEHHEIPSLTLLVRQYAPRFLVRRLVPVYPLQIFTTVTLLLIIIIAIIREFMKKISAWAAAMEATDRIELQLMCRDTLSIRMRRVELGLGL